MHCDFCDEFGGGQQNGHARRYGKLARRVIYASEHFRVVPSLGQIVEGHLLVVTREHFRAAADLPSQRGVELNRVLRHVRSNLHSAYGECVFFEHGIRGAHSGGCGIDHAHVHAIPVAAQGVLGVLMQEFGGNRVASFEAIKESLSPDSSYLFFEEVTGERYMFPVDNLPSQYMRKLVAESVGKADWDWRASGREPELISSIQRLSPLFSPLTASVRG